MTAEFLASELSPDLKKKNQTQSPIDSTEQADHQRAIQLVTKAGRIDPMPRSIKEKPREVGKQVHRREIKWSPDKNGLLVCPYIRT